MANKPWVQSKSYGFTLIELIIVIAIIGILTALAIAQYTAYTTRSMRSVLLHDARSYAISEEAYFVHHGFFTSIPTELEGNAYGAGRSRNSSILIQLSQEGYNIVVTNSTRPDISVTYKSNAGGTQ